jgi:glycosyltransferase involved in cell wall biosynthesis
MYPETRPGRLIYTPIAGILAVVLFVATRYVYRQVTDPAALAVWWIGIATLLFCGLTFFRGGRARPPLNTSGRVVAIVTAHERETGELHACVWSILDQRGVVVGEVHVVDDGSTERPIQPFAHPRVRWHRTRNGGRPAAVSYVLDRLDADDWDFVLIADGDCVLDERSIERQLAAFARPGVTATIGTVIARNPRPNLLTRVAELNIGASSALPMPLNITSDTPVLYRARIPFRNRLRDLTAYAALEGRVAQVNDAVASTPAPAGIGTAFRQRLSWSTSWWRTVPVVMTRAGRLRAAVRLVIVPVTIACSLISLAFSGWAVIGLYAGLYLLVRYAATGLYLIERPGSKFWTWLLLTPAEAIFHLTFVIPIKYLALARLGRSDTSPPQSAPTSTVYYSGYTS